MEPRVIGQRPEACCPMTLQRSRTTCGFINTDEIRSMFSVVIKADTTVLLGYTAVITRDEWMGRKQGRPTGLLQKKHTLSAIYRNQSITDIAEILA
jgi:hypothetical protein